MVSAHDAVRSYPELVEVAALRASGWRFMPLRREDVLAGLMGFCQAGEDTLDALYVFDRDDCRAVRLLAEEPGTPGGIVWEYHGALAAAVHQLRSLPPPTDPHAPRLVLRPWRAL